MATLGNKPGYQVQPFLVDEYAAGNIDEAVVLQVLLPPQYTNSRPTWSLRQAIRPPLNVPVLRKLFSAGFRPSRGKGRCKCGVRASEDVSSALCDRVQGGVQRQITIQEHHLFVAQCKEVFNCIRLKRARQFEGRVLESETLPSLEL
jgi:hypothetical protein